MWLTGEDPSKFKIYFCIFKWWNSVFTGSLLCLISYTQNLPYQSHMLLPGTRLGLGSIPDGHAPLFQWGRQGSFLPPKCIPLCLLGWFSWKIIPTSLLLGWFSCSTCESSLLIKAIHSHWASCWFLIPPAIFMPHKIAALLLFLSLWLLCVGLLRMISFLRADVTSSTSCVLYKHLAKCPKHITWVQILGPWSTLVWSKPFTISSFAWGSVWDIHYLNMPTLVTVTQR